MDVYSKDPEEGWHPYWTGCETRATEHHQDLGLGYPNKLTMTEYKFNRDCHI